MATVRSTTPRMDQGQPLSRQPGQGRAIGQGKGQQKGRQQAEVHHQGSEEIGQVDLPPAKAGGYLVAQGPVAVLPPQEEGEKGTQGHKERKGIEVVKGGGAAKTHAEGDAPHQAHAQSQPKQQVSPDPEKVGAEQGDHVSSPPIRFM